MKLAIHVQPKADSVVTFLLEHLTNSALGHWNEFHVVVGLVIRIRGMIATVMTATVVIVFHTSMTAY